MVLWGAMRLYKAIARGRRLSTSFLSVCERLRGSEFCILRCSLLFRVRGFGATSLSLPVV